MKEGKRGEERACMEKEKKPKKNDEFGGKHQEGLYISWTDSNPERQFYGCEN